MSTPTSHRSPATTPRRNRRTGLGTPRGTSPSPTPRRRQRGVPSRVPNPVPLYYIDSRSPSPTPTLESIPAPLSQASPMLAPTPASSSEVPSESPPPYTPASPSRPARRRQQLPATPSRRSQCNTYAVQVGREGKAYTDLGEARVRYRALLQQGKQPGMVVARSLSRALAWIESGSTEDGQALCRQAILDALRIYRAEQSDLEESGDEVESDNSRATEDLEAELDARAARAEWRDLSE
ncbi:hypothetical protein B0H14DRAFT_3490331 [Mycena olivaceomarginata]|nr:hypothetical protein B0H14DRAFT_3490331 [Mycena olivaceomarginata]